MSKWGGLTVFGADVVKECNRLGILADLTHTSSETVNADLNVATKPMIITHTGLDSKLGANPVMAKMMRPRLISKEQAKIVADACGVLGVWTHLADTPLKYAQNIRALVDVVGVDHVCIGTKTKMTPTYRAAVSGSQPVGNQQAGPPRDRIGERTNEVWAGHRVGFYYAVVDALLKVNFTDDEIGKIGSGNFCHVFDMATSDHH